MLTFSRLKKEYNSQPVLSVEHLEIGDGLHWLQGANGSGKSTFLKIASGLIPFEGDVVLNGISLKKNRVSYKRLISYAEAEPVYPDFLTGEDLVRFYNSVRQSDKKWSDKLIERFAIGSYWRHTIGTYSSGMAKKISLVLAFLGSTEFILLDEPFVTLDVATVNTLINTINEYHRQGKNFIFTSHQSAEMVHLPITSHLLADHQTVCRLS
ncbi:MAG: ABC transporter ATP-binding protein [Bacteroidetes bacterium]|nr:ABC transporter ATP-binding protein [Bacteroidota bacterium]MBS1539203.1 ABC transporter ATP-binding protein [Bacteroidota bacterium]